MLRAIGLAFILVGNAFFQNRVPATLGRATEINDCAANKAIVRKLFDEWINKKDLAAIDEMVTPNFVSHEGGEDTNAEYAKKFLAGVFTSFPDILVTIEDIVCEWQAGGALGSN